MTYANVGLVLAALALTGAGLAVTLIRPGRLSRLEFLGAAYVLGFGAVGLLCVAVMLAGGRIGLYLPAATAILGTGLLAWRRPSFWAASRSGLAESGGKLLVALAAGGALFIAASGDDPGYDVRAFWSLKALSLERHGTFRNPDFLAGDLPHRNIRYPLLLPSVHALVYKAAGSDDGRAIRIAMALFYVASLGMIGAALRERLSPGAAAVATAVFAFTPAILTAESGGAMSGYADYPLAIFLFLGAMEAQRRQRDGDARSAVLSGLAFACASQLKLEGSVMAVVALFALPLSGLVARGARGGLEGAAIPALGVMLSAAWRLAGERFSSATPDVQTMAGIELQRIPGILRTLVSNLLRFKEWGLLWPATVLAAMIRPPRLKDPESTAFWTGALMFAAYVLVWAALPRENARDAMRHNTTRLVMHLAPLFFVWAAGRLGEARPDRASRPGS